LCSKNPKQDKDFEGDLGLKFDAIANFSILILAMLTF
jgi:hypothetical protein